MKKKNHTTGIKNKAQKTKSKKIKAAGKVAGTKVYSHTSGFKKKGSGLRDIKITYDPRFESIDIIPR